MGRLLRFSLLFLCFVTACLVGDDLWAQKGRGGGAKGGGGFKSGGGGGSWKGRSGGFQTGGHQGGSPFKGQGQGGRNFGSYQPQQKGKSPGGEHLADGQFGGKQTPTIEQASQPGGRHPGDKQRWNEQRKLEHRQKIANHLREINQKNGNENLNTVADRLDQKAQEHYEKRMAKLNSRDGIIPDADGALGDVDPALDGLGDSLDVSDGVPGDVAPIEGQIADVAQKLTGRENALYRQLRNEERKLNQRLEAVERLSQLYEQTGDAQFLDAAERLESAALDHYEQRLAKITEFQQRFNLPAFQTTPVSQPAP